MAKKQSREQLLNDGFAARSEAWSRWGKLHGDVLSHLLNPSLMGGPRWPAMRQAYRVARKGGVVLVASDGLSDPYDEGPQDQNGVGLEFFAATDDLVERPVADPVMSVGGTWLHDLVFQMSQNGAQMPHLAGLLDELTLLTTELYDVKIPEPHAARFVNDAGRVTVLLSLGCHPIPTRIDGPLSAIRFVHLQLLTVDELGFVMTGGDTARRQLADQLRAQKIAPLSRLDRPSAV